MDAGSLRDLSSWKVDLEVLSRATLCVAGTQGPACAPASQGALSGVSQASEPRSVSGETDRGLQLHACPSVPARLSGGEGTAGTHEASPRWIRLGQGLSDSMRPRIRSRRGLGLGGVVLHTRAEGSRLGGGVGAGPLVRLRRGTSYFLGLALVESLTHGIVPDPLCPQMSGESCPTLNRR